MKLKITGIKVVSLYTNRIVLSVKPSFKYTAGFFLQKDPAVLFLNAFNA